MTFSDADGTEVGETLGGSIHFNTRADGTIEVTVIGAASPEHALRTASEATVMEDIVGDWRRTDDGSVAYVERDGGYGFLFVPDG